MEAPKDSGPSHRADYDALKACIDELVSSGDLIVRSGYRLEWDEDGLLEIVTSNPEPGQASDPNCYQRLSQIIRILESPDGPQSTAWKNACLELRRLKDSRTSNVLDTNIKAWRVVLDAYNSTKKDVDYLKDISQRISNALSSIYSKGGCYLDSSFPEHACRLFGVDTPEHSSPTSWEDSLEEIMVRKNEEIHSLIDATWSSIKKAQETGYKELHVTQGYLQTLLHLDQFEKFEQVLYKKPLVMLKIKARSARKLQPNGREIEESTSRR
ncbi:hypothetical protein FDECE_403 [Fusarium decemcellulare]|nr:hypothetical protein FDECE_403 [Fusarium decemcellulare]